MANSQIVTEMKLQINKKVFLMFIIINLALLFTLYNIQIDNNVILENLCLFKFFTGNECFNCGMTRAFLSILHLDFASALDYNQNSIIIFLLTISLYLYTWSKFLFKKN